MKLRSYLFSLVMAGCGNRAGLHPDAATGCQAYSAAPSDAGCSALCAEHGCATGFCNLGPDDAGVYLLQCYQDHTGRRPTGLVRRRARGRSAVGRYFASAAHLEAASVPAFRELARELRRFGAPERFVVAARRSAGDEVRHARVMRRFAHAYGAVVPPVVVRAASPRTLAGFARHNAVEGCVKETYGAVIAVHQSVHATDRAVREAMAGIAHDELRHAELAWQIDTWLTPQLSVSERAGVEHARQRAAAQLTRDVPARRHALLGLPDGAIRRAFADELARQLWIVDGAHRPR